MSQPSVEACGGYNQKKARIFQRNNRKQAAIWNGIFMDDKSGDEKD